MRKRNMKKWWMVCAALVCVLSAQGQAVRQMYLYAVKGADSLYLDRYEAVPAVSGARPCMIFVFGGGFVDGTRDDARYVPFFEYMAAKGITVVSITHYMEEAAQADRVLVMSKGNVVMEGTPKEVFSQTEKVRALRLDVPQAAELRDELVKAGIPMPEGIIDTGACAQALYELLK